LQSDKEIADNGVVALRHLSFESHLLSL
jgi:hypothetical protein